jgi:TPR repeat protein
MTTSDSTQPEDYTILVDTQEKNNTLVIIAGVLILLVIGALWLFIPEDEEIELAPPLSQAEIDPVVQAQIDAAKQAPQDQQTDRSETAVTEIASFEAGNAPSQEQKVVSLAAVVAPNLSSSLEPGEQARELIRSVKQGKQKLSMEQLHQQARQLHSAGQDTDAYLLYFYAARQGHGPSAFELAQMNDPAYFSGAGDLLQAPDPTQAHKWYSIAAASQVAQAEHHLSELRANVEAAAAAGDPDAQRLLLNWK